MFARIDHIGVAVTDLDAAIALYEREYEMTLVHRETVVEPPEFVDEVRTLAARFTRAAGA